MKLVLSTICLLLACAAAFSQPWMNAPYLDVQSEADEWKRTNFYEIQAAFQRYEEAREALAQDPDAREAEEEAEGEEYE